MQKQKQPNLKKNASQKTEKRRAQAEIMVENQFRIGKCAADYAASIADPFSGPPDACLPVTPSIASRKVRTFIRGNLNIGTAGVGFLTAQPLASNDGSTAAGQVGTAASYCSGVSFAGAQIPILNTVTAGVFANNHNGDYSSAQFGVQGAQVRLVSMGLRVRWSSTELDRGGRIIMFEDPEHADYSNTGLTVSNLLANEKAREFKMSEDWTTLCASGPVMPQEYDFLTVPFGPYGSSGLPAHYLLCLVQGKAGCALDYEVYWNFEISGRNVRGKIRSDADDLGFTTVSGAIRNVKDGQLDSSHPLVKSPNRGLALKKIVDDYAARNVSGWVSKTIQGARRVAPYLKSTIETGSSILPYMEAFL